MMALTPGRLRLLHGTDEPFADMRLLRAGPATVLLDGVDLRYLRIGGTELVRRIYAAVRDVDWDTVPGVVSGIEIEESGDGFRIDFDVRHARREVDFAWHGTITGAVSGRIEYVFDGCAGAAFPFGRIGLCVHHPWRETAGARYTARTPDGEIEGTFPDLIGPQSFDGKAFSPLFPSFDHLEVELADGGRLVLDFEGDLWETEDHRNWTDANFKTYSTPISLGAPPPLELGQALRQRLVIEPVDVSAGMPSSGRARLTIGAPTETVVPPVGLGQDRDHHAPDMREREVLASLAPQHLRVELRLDRDWRSTLVAAQETATAAGAHLEVSLHLLEPQAGEIADVAAALATGPPVDRVLVINGDSRTGTHTEVTRPALVGVGPRRARAVAACGIRGRYRDLLHRGEPHTARPVRLGRALLLDHAADPRLHGRRRRREPRRAGRERAQCARHRRGEARDRLTDHHAQARQLPCRRRPAADAARRAAGLGRRAAVVAVRRGLDGGKPEVHLGVGCLVGDLLRDDRLARSRRARQRFGAAGGVPLGGGRGVPAVPPACRRGRVAWSGGARLRVERRARRGRVRRAHTRRCAAMCSSRTSRRPSGRWSSGRSTASLSLRRLNEATAAQAASDPAAFRASWEAASADGELELTLAPYEVVRIDPAA